MPRLTVVLLLAGFVADVAGRPVEGQLVSAVGATWIAVTVVTARAGSSPDSAGNR